MKWFGSFRGWVKQQKQVLSTPGRKFGDVAQVSNLPYRRFPIGRRGMARHAEKVGVRRLEALRYSRLETCATTTQNDSSAELFSRRPGDLRSVSHPYLNGLPAPDLF